MFSFEGSRSRDWGMDKCFLLASVSCEGVTPTLPVTFAPAKYPDGAWFVILMGGRPFTLSKLFRVLSYDSGLAKLIKSACITQVGIL